MRTNVHTIWRAIALIASTTLIASIPQLPRTLSDAHRTWQASLESDPAPSRAEAHETRTLTEDTPGNPERDPLKDPRRQIEGLMVHRDLQVGYSFLWPDHWQRHDLVDRAGLIYSHEQDPDTGFHVYVQDLDGKATIADLIAYRKRNLRVLQVLPDCRILHEEWIIKADATGFEVLLTYTRDGDTQVRLKRTLYHGPKQYTIYEQGKSRYEYEVFYDTFEFMYSTFIFGDLMDLLGYSRPTRGV